ncbi:MAG: PLP-dependent aminotransferase family protein [Thermoleophilaceae bacterium]
MDTDDVVVTTGGQQVIDLVVKTLIDPGDVVIAEGPTYPGAVPTFNAYQADVVQIDMDSEGMRVDLLEETIDALEREGRRLKFIYTVPTFQNPAGATMSLARRRRLVEIANERELLVLEDNPYGLLRYEGEPLPPLYRLDGGVYVMYLGTFSKILSPGIRLGWVVAPPPCSRRSTWASRVRTCAPPRLSQLMVQAYFERGDWQEYVQALTGVYRPRRDAMLEALGRVLPARGGVDPAGREACSCGPRCPTTSTPPTCSPAHCATTWPSFPDRARSSTAGAEARCGSTSRPPARTGSGRASAGSGR